MDLDAEEEGKEGEEKLKPHTRMRYCHQIHFHQLSPTGNERTPVEYLNSYWLASFIASTNPPKSDTRIFGGLDERKGLEGLVVMVVVGGW